MKRTTLPVVMIVWLAFGGSACQTTGEGTGIGALVGAGLGAVVGNNSSLGTAGGAAAGALVGGLLGRSQGRANETKQAQEAEITNLQNQLNSTSVNVQNSNGSVTPVVLHRVGNQWKGPRGEIYDSIPTPAQLKPVYGF
jgi:surface antigen